MPLDVWLFRRLRPVDTRYFRRANAITRNDMADSHSVNLNLLNEPKRSIEICRPAMDAQVNYGDIRSKMLVLQAHIGYVCGYRQWNFLFSEPYEHLPD